MAFIGAFLRALLVHNDNAGTNPEPREAIEAVLHKVGIETDYCAHDEENLAAALRIPVALIIDGTLADVVSALEDADAMAPRGRGFTTGPIASSPISTPPNMTRIVSDCGHVAC